MSLDRLIEKIHEKQNPTVVGLDPLLSYIPEHIKNAAREEYGGGFESAAHAIEVFNKGIIDAVCDIVPAVKPQCAYYELYGWQGLRALSRTIDYAKSKGMFVITDGKRNDIGSTMTAYAQAHLGETSLETEQSPAFGGDALTVNGYLGTDGISPVLEVCAQKDKGLFVLVKTSNPSAGELQDIETAGGEKIYEVMGGLCEKWGEKLPGKYGYSGVGCVVGATYPEQLAELRRRLPHSFFLVPGYGAQGGGAKDVLGGFDKRGLGAVVNSSRAVLCAYQKRGAPETEFAACAREEAIRMRDELMKEIGEIKIGTRL